MTTFKTNKFGAKRGDFDYLYGEYNSLEEAKKALKWTAVVGQQFAVINEENKAELYLWQGRDKEPTKVGSGGGLDMETLRKEGLNFEGKPYDETAVPGKIEPFITITSGFVGDVEAETHAFNALGQYTDPDNYFYNGVSTYTKDGTYTYNTYYGFGSLRGLFNGNKTSKNNTVFGFNSLPILSSGSGNNTAVGHMIAQKATSANSSIFIGTLVGPSITTGSKNIFIGNSSGAGITTGSGNTIIGQHANLPATTTNSIILFDGNKRKGFEVDNNGKTTAPAQTNELIEADTTGKAIITKEYFKANIPTSNGGDIDRLSLFDQNNNEIGYNSLSTSSGTAKGDYSVALGRNSESTSNYSMVMGALNNSNHDYTQLLGTYLNSSKENQTIIGKGNATSDANIIIGIGEDGSNRKNALEVYSDGRIIAPSITNTLIDADTTGKAIITKEYLTPKMLISILTSATEAEKTQIKSLLGL